MSQIPDHAAERVLNTIEEVVNSADEELEEAEQWMKALAGGVSRGVDCALLLRVGAVAGREASRGDRARPGVGEAFAGV